jgi:nicotinate-nucleotide--dimethylbenzimidazole phosphoribosyltransferase
MTELTGLIANAIKDIKPLDKKAMAAAQARQDLLTKPQGSLGMLEEISIRLAGIQSKDLPQIKNKVIIIMAGDHGVVAEKVGNWPQEVTTQMVTNFLSGGAGINVLTRHIGARVVIVDMGIASDLPSSSKLISRKIARGTQNIARGPAMTYEQAIRSIETGIEIVNDEIDRGLDIVGTGDMGIGNTTPSSAICAVITGNSPAQVTGRGTGITKVQLEHKTAVIEQAINVNRPERSDPVDVLAKVGGFEIGGLAGVMLGGAARSVPIVIDGFISGAAALIAVSLAPNLKDYLFAAHVSAEKGHRILLRHLGLTPLLDLNMRLGEGTGAALAIYLAEASVKILSEMATFGEAGVSERTE